MGEKRTPTGWHLFTCSFLTGGFTSSFLMLFMYVSMNKSPQFNESKVVPTANTDMFFLCYHFSFLYGIINVDKGHVTEKKSVLLMFNHSHYCQQPPSEMVA